MTTMTYQSPVLTDEERKDAEKEAKKFIVRYGFANALTMVTVLFIENVRLVKEIQEHRAARGIEPLEVFEV